MSSSNNGDVICRRSNGFERPYSTMQLASWVCLPVLLGHFLLFLTPILPPTASGVCTFVFLVLAVATIWNWYRVCSINPMDDRLARHLRREARKATRAANGAAAPAAVGAEQDSDDDDDDEADRKRNFGGGDVGGVDKKGDHLESSTQNSAATEANEQQAAAKPPAAAAAGAALVCGHKKRAEEEEDEDEDEDLHAGGELDEHTKYCWVCQVRVEEHSMHCKFCNKCVSKFDHHCFWLGTCVGKKNYRYFFGTVCFLFFFVSVHGVTDLAVVVAYFVEENSPSGSGPIVDRMDEWFGGAGEVGVAVVVAVDIFFLVFSLVAVSLVGQLLLFHVQLRKEGITTYEHIIRDNARKRDQSRQEAELQSKRAVSMARARDAGRHGEVLCITLGQYRCFHACDPIRKRIKEERRAAEAATTRAARSAPNDRHFDSEASPPLLPDANASRSASTHSLRPSASLPDSNGENVDAASSSSSLPPSSSPARHRSGSSSQPTSSFLAITAANATSPLRQAMATKASFETDSETASRSTLEFVEVGDSTLSLHRANALQDDRDADNHSDAGDDAEQDKEHDQEPHVPSTSQPPAEDRPNRRNRPRRGQEDAAAARRDFFV